MKSDEFFVVCLIFVVAIFGYLNWVSQERRLQYDRDMIRIQAEAKDKITGVWFINPETKQLTYVPK